MIRACLRIFLGCLLVVFIWIILPYYEIQAAQFNRHYIISDLEFFDDTAMNLEEIQNFLEQKNSFLATYKTKDAQGITRLASEIIYNAAKEYIINPKTLLVTLQKEQSLIEAASPTIYNLTWAAGYSRCDDCSVDDVRIAKYKGFGIQIDRAAWRFRYYVNHPEEFNFHIGQAVTVDGELIVPANQATVNLYNYTPHLDGNKNFWKLWQRYFAKEYPDGTLLQQKNTPGVWLIQRRLKRPILTKSALISRFDSSKIIQVEKADLDKYDEGKPIKFPQYSILRSPGGTVYLIDGDTRRGFASSEAFRATGINPEEIIDVEWEDLDLYTEAMPITTQSQYPTGALIQDQTTGAIFYVQNGKRHPIWSREIFESRFKNYPVINMNPDSLDKYILSDPIGFRDGELITSPGYNQVFIISNGKRRPFASADVFNSLGYKWEKIIHTSDQLLNLLHPLGPPVNI